MMRTGCRTVNPALARWTVQPTFALATNVAPDRRTAWTFR